jgi:hypothetical protein
VLLLSLYLLICIGIALTLLCQAGLRIQLVKTLPSIALGQDMRLKHQHMGKPMQELLVAQLMLLIQEELAQVLLLYEFGRPMTFQQIT